jgi:hypothetical protein
MSPFAMSPFAMSPFAISPFRHFCPHFAISSDGLSPFLTHALASPSLLRARARLLAPYRGHEAERRVAQASRLPYRGRPRPPPRGRSRAVETAAQRRTGCPRSTPRHATTEATRVSATSGEMARNHSTTAERKQMRVKGWGAYGVWSDGRGEVRSPVPNFCSRRSAAPPAESPRHERRSEQVGWWRRAAGSR